jgi:hypothetical protein
MLCIATVELQKRIIPQNLVCPLIIVLDINHTQNPQKTWWLIFISAAAVNTPKRRMRMRSRTLVGSRLFYGAIVLALVGMCASVLTMRIGAQDEGGGWRIVRAQYGWRDRQTDVTDLVRDLIERGGVNGRVVVNNQTMGGDPAVSRDKTLRIIARNRHNLEREFVYVEGAPIDVALFAVRRDEFDDRPRGDDRRDDRGEDRGDDRRDEYHDDRAGAHREVAIVRAYWGVQGRTANVTELLRNMQRENGLQVMANNRSLGGDPAPGVDKVLIVIYRVQGQETAAAVREGNILTIP